jgi:hypothetical protein
MNEKIFEMKKEIEKEIDKETQPQQQQQQQKKKKHILYVYICNQEPQRYDSKQWYWKYESETIRGYIQEYAKPETDIALYKYNILSIMKRDKTQLRIISGNYATQEIFDM